MSEEEKGLRAPQSLEAERSVLGAMLLDQEIAVEILDSLGSEDFHDRKHRRIFQACRDLDARNTVLDMVTVSGELDRIKMLEEAGGLDYLASLTQDIPFFSSVQEHIRIIRSKSMLRKLLKVSRESITEVLEGTSEPGLILDQAEQKIMAISESRSRGEFRPLSQLVGAGIEAFEHLMSTKDHVTGLSTGFDQLDKMTTGFHKGELIILAARPSLGKTSLALNIARHVATTYDQTVAFFSLEMSGQMLAERLLCTDSKIGRQGIIRGSASRNHWDQLIAAADRLQRLKIFIDETAGLGSMELRARARSLKRREGLCMIFVDYLQLMRGEGNSENRQQEIARISGDLKAIAKELEVPVLALSQLSRMGANREGAPHLSDLRESGAIEQDADVVLFLHRKDKSPGNEMDQDGRNEDEYIRTSLNIGKQRNGPVGEIPLMFNSSLTLFTQVDPLDDYSR